MLETITKSQSLFERRKSAVANGVGVFNTATVKEAKGAIIIDVDGNELIDFAGGIGVVNAGHCPAPVVQAVKDQADKYLHTSFNVVTYEPYIKLCEELCKILPHGDHTKAMLVSTGAEAVENAIKIARQATKKQGIICFTDAFHGRTMMALTLTSKIDYKIGCGPLAPEVYRLPFPNYYRYGKGESLEDFVDSCLVSLEASCKNLFDPNNIAAVILEPVQGEGGFNAVPQKYFEGLRKFCDEHGILLIADEIQSGFARTGNWASWQNYNVQPDLSTYAKSLGSGLPIAAVVGKADIMDAAAKGTLGGTYIGNPLACAAASATIQYMKDINLNERAIEVGNTITKRFEKIQDRFKEVGDVRGTGAMNAIEFVKNGDPNLPDTELCAAVVKGCSENGLIVISAGTYKNVIRILSPLVIEDEVLNRGLDIIENQIQEKIQNKL